MKINSVRLALTTLALAALAACGGSVANSGNGDVAQNTDSHSEAAVVFGSHVHKMPLAASATNTATTANLQYYGGHVISNVKVYAVFWGSNVNTTVKGKIGQFYSAFTQSPMFDWLNEYNTDITAVGGQQGTNQIIGRGTFEQAITITPSITKTTFDDTDIQAELNKQITSGALPAPDANTIYMINFPKGLTITQGGSSSCQAFCAYHGTFTRSGQSVFYGVLPSLESGTGCDLGCGSGATMFDNQTSVASHELIEAVTDAEVGLATTNGPPLAWYDNSQGEIGDICNAQQGSFLGNDGVTYTVQKEWSNQAKACITAKAGSTSDDFSLSLSPSSVSVAAGGSTHLTVSTAVVSGNAESITLSVSGLPSGVTGSFSPVTVTAGQTSTLTLTASSSAAAASADSFTVTGKATTGSHSQGATVSVTTSGGGGGGGGSALSNGVPVSNLSGATGSQTVFTLAVPTGASNLKIATSGGTGDVDLYVKFGSAPTTSSYDCRPYVNGNNETCTPATATAGTWYVMLNGYAAYSGVTLVGSYDTSAGGSGDFSLSLSSTQLSVAQGGSATFTVSTAVVSGSATSITLKATSLPTGVTATFNPATVTAGQSAKVTLTASSTAALISGDSFRVYGSGSGYSHYRTGYVTVTSGSGGTTGGDFSLSLSSNQFTLSPGGSQTITVSTAVVSGSADAVSFHVTSLPTGVTATFGSTSVTAGGSTTLTLHASSSAAAVSGDSIRVYGQTSSYTHYKVGYVTVN